MVAIEPCAEESRVDVAPTPKEEQPTGAVRTEAAEQSSREVAESAAEDASEGFETASESEFNGGGDDNDDEYRHQLQQQKQQSVPPKDDSLEATSNDDELRQKALAEANEAKMEGNKLFGGGQYEEALSHYEAALRVAPDIPNIPSSLELRSICHANRGLCFLKLVKYEDSIKECTKALELNPNYVKALLRRGEAHEKLEHYEEAIADLKKILELDQSDVQARRTIQRLEPLAEEKRERMKQEMIDKLKDMGNSILGRFGMSVDNFKAVKDPNTGSYSISFQR
ncbi:uncharacterized protein LOC127806129 [Diospyros lotus]|uniref:uncharacterized protein LOC127806129 n=1 Tax=Diospyros lotus TaxID=55363 RepID=UPI0022594188|nr:uncharacterized protein LOC127806129 [Diospyros lotus]